MAAGYGRQRHVRGKLDQKRISGGCCTVAVLECWNPNIPPLHYSTTPFGVQLSSPPLQSTTPGPEVYFATGAVR